MPTQPTIHYQVSLPNPRSHYYHVAARFEGPLPDVLTIALPVWTPGSYLVREYARHVVQMTAESGGQALTVDPRSKSEWQIAVPRGATEVTVHYEVFAYELTVRTSYLDDEYGLITGTSLFVYHEPWKTHPVSLELILPPGWDAATALDPHDAAVHRYVAPDYDTLVDSPIQMGRLHRYSFVVDNIPHSVVVAGHGAETLPRSSFLQDLAQIVAASRDIFGELPYTHYDFLVTLTEQSGGGLEHLNSANIMVSRKQWRDPKDYSSVLSLFAHEFFHLWNVKRLRPTMLGPFNYQSEVYTSLLWALEGITDYFAQWLLANSQVLPVNEVLTTWARSLQRLERQPGREWTSLAAASREAWIRQYRPDANTTNITISYYLKGALVGLYLDLELRRATEGRSGLSTIMRDLWDRYGDRGYPESTFERRIAEVGGTHLKDLMSRYVHGTDPFDDTIFETVGLRLDRAFSEEEGHRLAWLGLDAVERNGRVYARSVERGGPAEQGGVSPDDEIVALQHERIATVEQWHRALAPIAPEQTVTLHTFHHGVLESRHITAVLPRPDDYRLLPVGDPTLAQRTAFEHWLGVAFPKDS